MTFMVPSNAPRYRALLIRSAMRNEINLRGLVETGRPPLLTLARASMLLVRAGSSSYSFRETLNKSPQALS